MKKRYTFILLLVTFLQFSTGFAQDLLKSTDLSTLKVDNLTEADLSKIKAQLQSNNMTLDQAEPMALAKGMSAAEFSKLRARLATTTISGGSSDTNPQLQNSGRTQEKISNSKVKGTSNTLVFGSELFDNPTLNFEPDLKLATPVNYVLGPGDELQVSVYGVQEFNASIPVSIEGKISIPYVGQLAVSGMTIEAASQKIKNAIAGVYSTVASGQSQVDISLSRIRTIKVTIIGSKQPGNYSVSSLATVYNALFLGGGPALNGSYRNIELLRNNKVYRVIDLYRFLVKGDQSDNVGLKDNDVIRIPSYTQRVTITGEVKRPGIFEMKKGETFSDLVSFASGFNEIAYTASVSVTQKTNKEFKVRDILKSEFNSYLPQAGDVFQVTKILNRFENRISIEGAVFRPNTYSFYEGMRISDLVAKAEGLKEDAYTQRARIVRLKSDLSTEIINANLAAALSGDANADILLQREDIVTVYSVLDFREEYNVTIAGEVRNPGEYTYLDNLTLNDLLVQAGGLTGSASKRVEIARMIKSDNIYAGNPNRIELIHLELTPENNEQLKNYALMPFDVISIRRVAVYEKPQMVSISGAVVYPGSYVLENKKETIFNIVSRAGGLKDIANTHGVKIKRPVKADQIEQLQSIDLNLPLSDSSVVNSNEKLKNQLQYATIPVDWNKIEKDPGHYSNVTLFPGDQIEVAELNEGVRVSGNVLLNSEIPYRKGKSFRYYLSSVGGVDAKGWKKKAYIIYPNGKADVTGSFLFFRSYPKVLPDSQIIVPEKPERKKLSAGEVVGFGSVISSLALLIITAFK
ncbi:SLBB domain-containing protein [Flavobacterium sp. ST-87]|uniref:SLBB domain-containing protein n=1 Tax=Flavobacterium plantiphilum TaxID=3163297 RepID=A0ABW8XVY4_9FLAO